MNFIHGASTLWLPRLRNCGENNFGRKHDGVGGWGGNQMGFVRKMLNAYRDESIFQGGGLLSAKFQQKSTNRSGVGTRTN